MLGRPAFKNTNACLWAFWGIRKTWSYRWKGFEEAREAEEKAPGAHWITGDNFSQLDVTEAFSAVAHEPPDELLHSA